MYSCCGLKHGYSKPKCHTLYSIQLIFLSIQRTAQTSFRIFLQTRIMVDGAKFKSYDKGGHFYMYTFKNGRYKKNSHIFVIKLKLQVRLSMQSLHRHTLLTVWKSQLFFLNRGMRLKLSSAPLSVTTIRINDTISKLLDTDLKLKSSFDQAHFWRESDFFYWKWMIHVRANNFIKVNI